MSITAQFTLNKKNRSFSRRVGKTLSTSQKKLLNLLPKYSFCSDKLINSHEKQSVFLEIGFGMGEHLFHQANSNPSELFIGVEVYLNGVANLLRLIEEQNLNNILLWSDDLDKMINLIPAESLSGIWLLFSDPWTKRKQHKKRLLNQERLSILSSKLKTGAFLIFASDIEDYFYKSKDLILENNFELINTDLLSVPENYIPTKYHQKALAAGRIVRFLQTVFIRSSEEVTL